MTEQSQKTAYQRLKEFEEKGCHMLIPSAISIEDIAPGFALIVEPVRIKAHPRDKDVYAHESSQYDYKADDWKSPATGREKVRIHKQGLDRLAQAAKVDWLPAQIIRDPNHSGRMMASVEGMIRTSTGELYRVQDIYGMDLEIERAKIIASYSFNGKFDDKKQYLVDDRLREKDNNQAKSCISGAKNRVIKQLLCLRNTYSVADLEKEFVAVRIVPRLDMNDEYTRRRVVDVQIAAMAGIYGLIPGPTGNAPQKQIEMVGNVDEAACQIDDNIVDAEPTTYRTEPDPELSPLESQKLDFQNSEVANQCQTLSKLATQKGYDLNGWQTKAKQTLAGLTASKRVELFTYLMGLPEPGQDVPFAMGGN